MKRGGFLKTYVLISGLVIAILMGAVFYVYTRPKKRGEAPQTQTQEEPSTRKDSSSQEGTNLTKNWKPYEDDYGFAFLYPPDFTFNFEYPGAFGENYPLKVITLIPPDERATEITFTIIGGTLKRNPADELGALCTTEETALGAARIPVIARTCGGAVTHSVSYKMQLKNNTLLTVEISGGRDPSKEIPEETIDALLESITVEK